MFQAMKLEKRLKISKNIVLQKIFMQFLENTDLSKKHSKTAYRIDPACSITDL